MRCCPRFPHCALTRPVATTLLHLLQFEMPGKALAGDLNTPPKVWRKLPRITRCQPLPGAPQEMHYMPVPQGKAC